MAEAEAPGTPGFRLTESQRLALQTRLMLQAPTGLTPRQIANVARDLDSRIRTLPPGAFMALHSLMLLADQGNRIASHLFRYECARLGLEDPIRSVPG